MSEYSVDSYGSMIHDSGRIEPYARALERAVEPGSVVLDIGAGSGILSLLAVRAGARQVYAVEPAEVVELGRELVAANGLSDRISFIQATSQAVSLPEPADVIVSDLRGVLPLYTEHIPSIVDARERHLRAGGMLIPLRDTLRTAPVELTDLYEKLIASWDSPLYGFDLAGARSFAANDWRRAVVPANALLSAPGELGALDYATVSDPNFRGSVSFAVERPGTVHGVVIWFESELAEGVRLSNAPTEPEKIYGQAFFPISEPVEVAPGDGIGFAFSASLIDGEYLFRWDTEIASGADVRASFIQSTLFATPVSAETLARRRDGHAAALNDEGEAVAHLLGRIDGRRALSELAQDLERSFPRLFGSTEDALRFATDLSGRYTR